MAATPITPASRFFRPGTTKAYWVVSISNKTAPTRLELNAGADLSKDIADIAGWMVSGQKIDTPDLNSRFVSNIPGLTSAGESGITFYASDTGLDVRSLMPRDTAGFIVWMDGGDVAGRKMDVFPVRVLSVGKQRSMGAEAARLAIQYAVTSEPAEDVTIPA
ncbi:phage tail tube protein [Streptosporangium canum]|uniref:phage tail tube protein n=1 Tax=Streptosporangium canum TaxID=324952 RepID=UPI003788606A